MDAEWDNHLVEISGILNRGTMPSPDAAAELLQLYNRFKPQTNCETAAAYLWSYGCWILFYFPSLARDILTRAYDPLYCLGLDPDKALKWVEFDILDREERYRFTSYLKPYHPNAVIFIKLNKELIRDVLNEIYPAVHEQNENYEL